MNDLVNIRLATEGDSVQLVGIYGPFVRDTCVSFEYEEPTEAEFANRIRSVNSRYPWLVCEVNGKVVGYAYASKHRERAAYQWSVDVSVYVDPDYHRRGIATALYSALLELLRFQGFYNVFAGIAMPNEKSEGLHKSFGFEQVANFRHVGYKNGGWHDVKWYELTLYDLPEKPVEPKGIDEIKGTKEYEAIINNALKILNAKVPPVIRSYRKEDLNYIIDRHGELYCDEYGFGPGFRDYVEKYVLLFDQSHDPSNENIWVAEHSGKPAGSIAIVKSDGESAQLRWFLIEPGMRGMGLGRRLMETAIGFCRENRYKHVFLWTVSILDAARHLYESFGFTVTETKRNDEWAGSLIEERWDLDLS